MKTKMFRIQTEKEGFYNITNKVMEVVKEEKINSGICIVFCPHTTAAITLNENTDIDVPKDILLALKNAFPEEQNFKHNEGNSTAHIKASCLGATKNIIIENQKLLLGTWQGIFFCEFDGPRDRTFYVKVIADN